MSLDDFLIGYKDGTLSDVELRTEIRRARAEAASARRSEIRDYIARFLSQELEVPGDQIDPAVELPHYGVDSLVGRRLMRDLADRFDVALSGRDMLDHRTVEALTLLVHKRMQVDERAEAAPRDYLREFRAGLLDMNDVKQLISQGMIA